MQKMFVDSADLIWSHNPIYVS